MNDRAGSAIAAWPRRLAGSTKELEPQRDGFDYIVVGGGSAGCVTASRLAGATDARVLLLEAGGDDGHPDLHDPLHWPDTLDGPACRRYATVPQAGTAGSVHSWPRGVVLGGSSAINALIFARGHPSDFAAWAKAAGSAWGYSALLPTFKAMEDFAGGADDYRGVGGPLHVSTPAPGRRHPTAEAFAAAAEAQGFPFVPDINGATMEGVGWADLTIRDGRRVSAAKAFLTPAAAAENLRILLDAPAVQLLIEHGRCVGVRYLHNGQPVDIRAEREVILAAGAIESPKLLMLSGIGPADVLRQHGIAVAVDRPEVGRNLQDHLLIGGIVYRRKGSAPESLYNRSEIYLWWRSRNGLDGPDLMLHQHTRPFALGDCGIAPEDGYSILPGLARPHSRGTLGLASADPQAPPVIDPAYYSDERDLDALVRSVDICRAIGEDPAYGGLCGEEVFPGPAVRGKAAVAEFVRRCTHTFFHPTSTCRMGADDDAVVDPELKVNGIDGLRVADASVMPVITSANTNAPSLLIGWRCAELIARSTAG